MEKNSDAGRNFRSFEDLEVWKLSRELRKKITELVETFPDKEKYRLQDQILRAARSVTAQIAEGFGRYHYKENIQFCRISRGSLFELKDHLIVALDGKYISETKYNKLRDEIETLLKVLNGYIKYLKTRVAKI